MRTPKTMRMTSESESPEHLVAPSSTQHPEKLFNERTCFEGSEHIPKIQSFGPVEAVLKLYTQL